MKPGDTLAHYEIRAPLGKGGMGEVFMGSDTKLGRDVALKVLPEDFARDTERVARFRREAQVLASLNHPNISAIYGLEEDGGRLFLAMELARGQDLSQRLSAGPLSLDEALRIALLVAAGLAEAHDKGIVHRDLKPANVVADTEGTVKILDFGLARAFGGEDESEDESGNPSHSPTLTAAMTQPGMVLGTAAYMSPEQARGQVAGKQSDIWAFGCLLFEMLTGQKIFAGNTVSDSVAAILKNDPPWDELPPDTPAPVRRLLLRCLEKKKRRRLHDIGDAWIEIEDALEGKEQKVPSVAAAQAPNRRRLYWPLATGALAIAVAVLALRGSGDLETSSAGQAPRITELTQLTDQAGLQIEPALSPDGRTLAYSSWDDGDQDIFIQRVGGTNPINLTAGHGGLDATPAFSPDGERIAFHSEREGGGLFVMGATGETPLRVAAEGVHPCWSPDGKFLAYTTEYVTDPYSRNYVAYTWISDLETGEIRRATDIDAVSPSWSPSGKRLVFWSHLATVQGQRDIYTIAVDGGPPVAVTEDNPTDWSPQWSPDGRWIYFISDRGGSPDLWRVGIDEATGLTTGDPEAVTAGMARVTELAISASGSMALTSATGSGELYSMEFDPVNEAFSGNRNTLLTSSHPFLQMSLATDGALVAYRTSAPQEHIYVMNPDGSNRRRLIADQHRNRGPEFSPDNRWVVFYSNRSGSYDIWAVRTDGTGLKPVTLDPETDFNDPGWSSDGRLFALTQNQESFIAEINLPEGGLDALTEPISFTAVPGLKNAYEFNMSPDSRRAVFFDTSEDQKVFVQDMDSGKRESVMVNGRPARMPDRMTWLDKDRVVLWESQMRQIVLWNAATSEGKFLTGLEGPASIKFTDQGRLGFINRTVAKSDIWVLTLGQ